MKKKLLLIPVVFASLSTLFGCSSGEKSGYHENTLKDTYSGEEYHDSNPIPGDYAEDHETSETEESIPVGTYGSADPLFTRGKGELAHPEDETSGFYVYLTLNNESYSVSQLQNSLYVRVGTDSVYGFVYLDEERTKFSPVFLNLEGSSYVLNLTVHLANGTTTTIKQDSGQHNFYFNGRKIGFSPSVTFTKSQLDLEKYQKQYGVYVAHNIGLKGIAEMIYYSPVKLGLASTTESLYAWSYSEALDEIVRFDSGEVYYMNRTKGTWLELHHMAEQLGGCLAAPYSMPSKSFISMAFENDPLDYGMKKYDGDLYIGLFYKHGDFTKAYRLDNGNTNSYLNYPNSEQSDTYFNGKLYPDTDPGARFLKITRLGTTSEYVSLNVDGTAKLYGMFKFPSLEAIGESVINPYYEG